MVLPSITGTKQKKLLWGTIFLGISLIIVLLMPDQGMSYLSQINKKQDQETSLTSPVNTETNQDTNTGSFMREKGIVVRVVDGDTIHAMVDGNKQRVRLIGIDTPESQDPRKDVECFAEEASARLKALVGGETVFLEADASQGDTDTYGRVLRYVFIDEMNVNQRLLEEGYAYEYTYDLPYRYQSVFRVAERQARGNNLGLWSPQTCAGQRTDRDLAQEQPSPQILQEEGNEHTAYQCNCARSCNDISTCEEAQYLRNECGCDALDGDGDSIPCERGPC